MTESERFQRAEAIFHEALAKSPDAQADYIAHAAGGDAALAAQVHRLISYARHAPATIALQVNGAGHASDTCPDKPIGGWVGRYRLSKFIGEGGFGVVYEAQQEQPVRRTVALKILRNGFNSRQVIGRFAAEQQALALMDHPNIARVFDAGQTEDALGEQPYFVMELVRGQPITAFCNDQQLNVPARLELFSSVCLAVQHAHQRGIIHRDLKPSNILVSLVDGVPAPKIIDFGIAKAIHDPTMLSGAITQQREFLGTPQYMSPEQAGWSDQGIDTRTDIYSLGVILYELMTGSTPIDPQTLASSSLQQVRALVTEGRLERPSLRIRRLGQQAVHAGLGKRNDLPNHVAHLRGDLDWIIMKAIDADRDRRYSSAAALADDIRRHLNHEPVLAGPPSAWYRSRKFVRRHRVGVAAAALIFIAVLGGILGTIAGMLRARDAAAQALAVNSFMREILSSADPDQRGAEVRLVEVLDDASRRAAVQFAGHPKLEAEVRELLAIVYAKQSRLDPAMREARRAVELRIADAGRDHPDTLAAQLLLGRALNSNHRGKELDNLMKELLPRVRNVFGPQHRNTAIAECLVGRAHLHRGRDHDAERDLRATHSWVSRAFPGDDEVRLDVVKALLDVLLMQHRLLDPASEQAKSLLSTSYDLAIELRDGESRRKGPDSLPALIALARLSGILLEQQRYEEVVDICQQILERSQGVLSDCHDVRNDALWRLAEVTRLQGRCAEAADMWMQRIECLRSIMPANDPLLAMSLCDALPYLEFGGRWSEGEALARELCDSFKPLGAVHGPLVFGPEIYLARFLTLQGRLDEAQPIFERWLSDQEQLTENHNRARLHLFHAGFLMRQQQFEEAERAIDLCRSILPRSRGTWKSHPDDICNEYIMLYETWGKPEKAEPYRRLREQYLSPSTQALTRIQ